MPMFELLKCADARGETVKVWRGLCVLSYMDVGACACVFLAIVSHVTAPS